LLTARFRVRTADLFEPTNKIYMEEDMWNQRASAKMIQSVKSPAPKQQNCGNRRTSPSQLVCLGLLMSSMLLVGLATRAQDSSNEQDQASKGSGFLDDYAKLQPDPKNSDLLIYWQNEDVLKNSSKFILDPVTVYLLPEAQQRGIDPEQLAKLARDFTTAIRGQLTKSGSYQVVTQPGPGVMVLRVAITNVEPNGGGKNAVVKGAATAATIGVAPGASLLLPRLSVGKVSIEGEIVDSTTGDVMVSFMSSKGGRRFFSGLKAYQKWADIDAAFNAWAKNFRERLDKAHES
jgi:hypothetical protein